MHLDELNLHGLITMHLDLHAVDCELSSEIYLDLDLHGLITVHLDLMHWIQADNHSLGYNLVCMLTKLEVF